MKSPYCWLCGRDFHSEWFHSLGGGELVRFRDYLPLPEDFVGHPQGLEWFCREHAQAARELVDTDSTDALVELQQQYGTFPTPTLSVIRDPSLWVTAVGPEPARVFAVFRQATGLPASEALAIFRSGTFEVARCWPQQFENWRAALIAAGAGVEVRYD